MLIFGNFIFIAAFVFLSFEMYCLKKSVQKQNGLLWLAISVWSVFCIHALAAAVYHAVGISIGTLSIGLTDLAAALLVHRYRRGQKQDYQWGRLEYGYAAGLLLLTALIGLARFGAHLDMVYRSVDATTHYYLAYHTFESGRIKAMYFSSLNDSLLVSLFAPFVKITRLYHVEPIADMGWFYLSGLTVFGFISDRCKGRFARCAGTFLGLFYLLGYPLDNLLMGFLYLGIGVSLAGVLLIVMDAYLEGQLLEAPAIGFLMLGCLGLITCYALFVPPVFLGIGLLFLRKSFQEQVPFGKMVLKGLGIFLIPCIVGFAYTWSGIFTDGVTISSAIALEGEIYRNNYSDYIPILPLALTGIAVGKKKGKSCTGFMLALEFLYMAFMLAMAYTRRFSGYYYYKNNHLFWLMLHLLAVIAVSGICSREAKRLICIYGCVWLIPLTCSLTGFEEALKGVSIHLAAELHGGAGYCAIYRDNYMELRKMHNNSALYVATPEKLALYEFGYELHKETGVAIFPVADEANRFFENVVTDQWDLSYLNVSQEECIPRLEREKPDYICVLKGDSYYLDAQAYYDQYEKVYENESGFIAVYGDTK